MARSARLVTIPQLPQGQANWMMDSLRSQGLPWGEKGYKDWFDYAAHAAKNIETRELYYQVGKELRRHEQVLSAYDDNAPEHAPSKRLYDLAVRTLVAHQYEFGCIGIAVDKEAQWQLARTALAVLWASELALRRSGGACEVAELDVNGDGVKELTVVDGDNAYVFSPKGERLLYWFNLEQGWQLVGNQNALCYLEPYRDDHSYVPDLIGGRDVFPQLNGKPEIEDLCQRRFVMRRRCLNETIAFGDSEPIRLWDFPFQAVCSADDELTVTFTYAGSFFTLEKAVAFAADGLRIHYKLHPYPSVGEVRVRVENELTPDYFSLMDRGREVVDVQASQLTAVIANRVAGCQVRIAAELHSVGEITCTNESGFLAWLCGAEIAAAPQSEQPIEWTLDLRVK